MSAAQKLKQRLFSAPPDAAAKDGDAAALKIDIPGRQGTASPRPILAKRQQPSQQQQQQQAEGGLPSSGNSVHTIPAPPGFRDRNGSTTSLNRTVEAVADQDSSQPSSPSPRRYSTSSRSPVGGVTEERPTYRQQLLNKLGTHYSSVEEYRLDQDREKERHWKRWGPYLSERQWATVREDYSADGDAWSHFPHDHARSRAYRWGEDGIAGVSDNHGRLNWSLGLWNEEDDILKERLFGVTGHQGNHGEDVKELYYYLDSTVSLMSR